jgi:hypothetical protein
MRKPTEKEMEEFKELLAVVEKYKSQSDEESKAIVAKAENRLRKIWPDYQHKTLTAICKINGIDPDEFRRKLMDK